MVAVAVAEAAKRNATMAAVGKMKREGALPRS